MLGSRCEAYSSFVCRWYGFINVVRQGDGLVRVEVLRGGMWPTIACCDHAISYIPSFHDLADGGLPEPTVLKLLLRRDLSCLLKHSGCEAAILQCLNIVNFKDHELTFYLGDFMVITFSAYACSSILSRCIRNKSCSRTACGSSVTKFWHLRHWRCAVRLPFAWQCTSSCIIGSCFTNT